LPSHKPKLVNKYVCPPTERKRPVANSKYGKQPVSGFIEK